MLAWLESYYQQLTLAIKQQHLSHALLFNGLDGLGKSQLTDALAALLLCQAPGNDNACGQCQSCLLFQAGTHPDLLKISPEEDSRTIKIAQIRALIEYAHKTPQISNAQVIVVNPVEAMNKASMNALLKTLEEPAGNTYLLLVTERMGALLPTIRSRCLIYNLSIPTQAQAENWLSEQLPAGKDPRLLLQLAQGAPLKALALAGDDVLALRARWFKACDDLLHSNTHLVELAATWAKEDVLALLQYLHAWLLDVWRMQLSLNDFSVNRDFDEPLTRWAARFKLANMASYLDELQKQMNILKSQVRLNEQLLLESILLNYLRLQK